MAYAIDILNDTFNKTKEQFFPIKVKYWLRMGFISMFGGRRTSSSSGGNSGYNSSGKDFPGMNFSEIVTKVNTEGLNYFSQYGLITGIGIFVLYLISLFFTYINSVFMFMFMEGLFNKDIRIKKSFKDNNKLGVSLFSFRFILGIISLIVTLLIFSPLLQAFVSNTLVNFNYWLLIPMFITWILFLIVIGILMFLVYDFVVPIMYLKKFAFSPAWKHFLQIASKKKLEIFLYWLIKIGLSLASVIVSFLIVIPLLFVILLLAIPFVLLGLGIYFLFNFIAGELGAIISVSVFGVMCFFLFIYLFSVVFVPIPAFFRMYSIEMVKKLDS